VARKVCKEVGLVTELVLFGDEVEKITPESARDDGGVRGGPSVLGRKPSGAEAVQLERIER
jgi:hypothetical protein